VLTYTLLPINRNYKCDWSWWSL